MPVLVAISRMYRGEHHPTDVLGSLVFAGLWLTATTMLIKPTAAESRSRRDGHGLRAVKKAVHVPGKAAAVSELHCACRKSRPRLWPAGLLSGQSPVMIAGHVPAVRIPPD
jgi:hypothetical protein